MFAQETNVKENNINIFILNKGFLCVYDKPNPAGVWVFQTIILLSFLKHVNSPTRLLPHSMQ